MISAVTPVDNPNEVAVLVHPIVGILTFAPFAGEDMDTHYRRVMAVCDEDIGEAFDLNSVGTLKSRVVCCWTEPHYPDPWA